MRPLSVNSNLRKLQKKILPKYRNQKNRMLSGASIKMSTSPRTSSITNRNPVMTRKRIERPAMELIIVVFCFSFELFKK
jgi:hypothetical protein